MSMNRIIFHHSGGGMVPSAFDLRHYHYMVDGNGFEHEGHFPVSANAPGKPLRPGRYAAHTRRLNTGSIGVALAAMAQGEWRDPEACRCFPTQPQLDAFVKLVARLCVEHGIEVTRRTVLSHAEVEPTLGVIQENKWDFDYDPWRQIEGRDPVEIGDAIRARVLDAIAGMGAVAPITAPEDRPLLRQGMSGEAVREMQLLLNHNGVRVDADSAFGPKTAKAVRAFQKSRQLIDDAIVGRMTWAALDREDHQPPEWAENEE